MTDPRRESGRGPGTTGGSGQDDETPENRAEALPQGDGDPRPRDDEQRNDEERLPTEGGERKRPAG